MLKRVKIQGYKSLANVEVHLQPLSVFFGPNAAGKSNFLDALQLLSRIATSYTLRSAFESPYRGSPLESFTFEADGIQGLLAQESVSFSIEIDVELSQAIVDAVNTQIAEEEVVVPGNLSFVRERYLRYYIEIEMRPKTGILYLKKERLIALNTEGNPLQSEIFLDWNGSHLRIGGGKTIRVSRLSERSHLLPYSVSFHPHLVAMRQELASWLFFYLEPRERMRIPTPVKEVRHIGLMGEDLAAFLNTLHALDEPQFKAVEKALHMILPSITGINVSVNNVGNIDLVLMRGQTPIPASVLSEGTLRILGLLALSGAKEPPTLLGFEEPENGIYPDRLDLVALLLKTLTSDGNTQAIVTTHSPSLLDLLPQESLYMFRQVDGNTLINHFSGGDNTDTKRQDEELTISERLLRGDLYA